MCQVMSCTVPAPAAGSVASTGLQPAGGCALRSDETASVPDGGEVLPAPLMPLIPDMSVAPLVSDGTGVPLAVVAEPRLIGA